VANAVTLQSEVTLMNWRERHGGELTRIHVAQAQPLGEFDTWRQALPITLLDLVKPSMRDETAEQPAPLRSGLTTGSCATATSLAAARLLLGGVAMRRADRPAQGQSADAPGVLPLTADGAEAGTIKDAGDDPT
jgi:hypothetical protein